MRAAHEALSALGVESGALTTRLAGVVKTPESIDVILRPGWVEDMQAQSMLTERVTAVVEKPLDLELIRETLLALEDVTPGAGGE